MADNRKWVRVAFGVFAVAVLSAAQPPDLPSLPAPPSLTLPPPAVQPAGGPSQPLQPLPSIPPLAPARRFDLTFDKKADAKDLLPVAPKASARGPVTSDDLKAIPEVTFAASPAKELAVDKRANEAARQIAKINHVNAKKTDAFMATLLANRPDLAGMPFAMGDDCRSTGDKLKYFTQAAHTVRAALGRNNDNRQMMNFSVGLFGSRDTSPTGVQTFFQQYTAVCDQQDAQARPDKAAAEHITLARVAALTQMLAAEPAEVRLGLVKYLTGVPHVESTKALARMAIYSAEGDVRDAALAALKVRREKDYTDVLTTGLRYPWPAVARRSAEAITKLERTDLVPQLLNMLEATDPRLPVTKDKATSVREMVKVNHHRNCLMCHAPNGSGTPSQNALTAEVAVEGQPLPSPSQGYRQDTTELLIRLDVTYLRQDFSATMHVADAHPWPEEQRFDFFVRERTLTADEAAEYAAKLTPKEEGVLSPYHKAAVTALRDLTGKDAAPTAAAWRKLLGVPRGE